MQGTARLVQGDSSHPDRSYLISTNLYVIDALSCDSVNPALVPGFYSEGMSNRHQQPPAQKSRNQ